MQKPDSAAPHSVSGETATCAQVVAERANTVGLLLVRRIRIKSGLPYCPTLVGGGKVPISCGALGLLDTPRDVGSSK